MRFIVGMGSRLWVWETSVTPVLMRTRADDDSEDHDNTAMDPAGSVNAHMELSPHALHDGATDPRRFGFYGSKDTSEAS